MKVFFLALIMICCVFAQSAFSASEINFSWEYSSENQTKITNFLIYKDNTTEDSIILQPAADLRAIKWIEEDVEKDHAYFIAAENKDKKTRSVPSVFAWYRVKRNPDPLPTPQNLTIVLPDNITINFVPKGNN